MIGFLLLLAILVATIFAIRHYYQRRVANLRTEIAHVQYIANQNGFATGYPSADRNHFDNPVYSYQNGAPVKGDDISLLNNATLVRNNLVKQNNLHRQRMAAPGCSTDDDDSGRSSELNSLKNRDADATNPNIYNSIEKVDHVYDEIQQKDCKDIELEYDHLDYSRPASTWKSTYQQMPGTLRTSRERVLDPDVERNLNTSSASNSSNSTAPDVTYSNSDSSNHTRT